MSDNANDASFNKFYRNILNCFKERYSEIKVGFLNILSCVHYFVSSQVLVAPILCVCTIHQNSKLLIESIKLCDLETSDG